MSVRVNDTHYIDLDQPDGNAFALVGIAQQWAKQIGIPAPDLFEASSYNDLLDQFDEAFKGRVTYKFLHDPRERAEDEQEEPCYVSDEY